MAVSPSRLLTMSSPDKSTRAHRKTGPPVRSHGSVAAPHREATERLSAAVTSCMGDGGPAALRDSRHVRVVRPGSDDRSAPLHPVLRRTPGARARRASWSGTERGSCARRACCAGSRTVSLHHGANLSRHCVVACTDGPPPAGHSARDRTSCDTRGGLRCTFPRDLDPRPLPAPVATAEAAVARRGRHRHRCVADSPPPSCWSLPRSRLPTPPRRSHRCLRCQFGFRSRKSAA